ncbi:MAG TPA: hypothetical protein VFC29_24710 [Candidatus Limnocylindrales bacterium]|nr:hypothetical protein [Candidatus Limnocylindrales bacterium]
MSCAICSNRKEKRFCLAVHGRICPQCCGEQRERTLDCPSECPYLQQARQHEKPRQLEDAPPEEVFPKVELSDEFLQAREPVISGILQTIGKLSRRDRSLNDREVIAALVNLAKSYQTLVGSGLIYEQVPPSLAQQALIEAVRRLLQEFRELEREHLGYTTLKDAEVLKVLVLALRLAHIHTSGRPLSRAFLDFLHDRFAEALSSIAAADEPGSRIIMP